MKTGIVQANGAIEVEPTFNVEHVAEMVLYISKSSVGHQRVIDDHNGNKNALCRAGLMFLSRVRDGGASSRFRFNYESYAPYLQKTGTVLY